MNLILVLTPVVSTLVEREIQAHVGSGSKVIVGSLTRSGRVTMIDSYIEGASSRLARLEIPVRYDARSEFEASRASWRWRGSPAAESSGQGSLRGGGRGRPRRKVIKGILTQSLETGLRIVGGLGERLVPQLDSGKLRQCAESHDQWRAFYPALRRLSPDVVHAVSPQMINLIGWIMREHPDSLPRNVQIIADLRTVGEIELGLPASAADMGPVCAAWRVRDAAQCREAYGSMSSDQSRVWIEGQLEQSCPERPPVTSLVTLGIAGDTGADSGWALKAAIQECAPHIATHVWEVEGCGIYSHRSDVIVERDKYFGDEAWALRVRAECADAWTHVLLGGGSRPFGIADGRNLQADIDYFNSRGTRVALAFFGSDIRDPYLHRELHPWSPFSDPDCYLSSRAALKALRNERLVRGFGGPVFVATPDLLDFVQHGVWLPHRIDVERVSRPKRSRRRPIVVHAPSHPHLKGTAFVEQATSRLVDEGLIEYRTITRAPRGEVLAALHDADIVVDQLLLGAYGVLTCEALASGAIAVCYLGQRFRDKFDEDLPIVEARPDTLESVLRKTVAEIDDRELRVAAGYAFLDRWHSGKHVWSVINREFLGC